MRIVKSIQSLVKPKREMNLLEMKNREDLYAAGKSASAFSTATAKLFSDHEVKILLLWAILSPSAALAYIIWIRYPQIKFLAVLLFIVSVFQFAGQWAGVYTIIKRMGLLT